jgi:hypothetical protein
VSVTREHVKAFLAGKTVPEGMRAAIEAMCDDPNSLVWKVAEEVAAKTRLSIDPRDTGLERRTPKNRIRILRPAPFTRSIELRYPYLWRHRFAVCLSALAAVGLVFFGLYLLRPSQPVILHDGRYRVVVSNGSITGLDDVPSAIQKEVSQALTTGTFPFPEDVSQLTANEPRRGYSSDALEAPVNTMVRSIRPSFRWQPFQAGAVSFRVIITHQMEEVRSPIVHGTEWQIDQDLVAGETYSWTVWARLSNGKWVPARDDVDPSPRFGILADARLAQLGQEEQAAKGSHLALALIYINYGLLDDAQREMLFLLKANPQSAQLSAILRHVEAIQGGMLE